MKKLFLMAVATMLLAACQKDDQTPEISIVGNWNLVEARSGWDGTVTPADDLPWSDSYEFKENGTFAKFNTYLGLELTGTYEEDIPDTEMFPHVKKSLTLTFDPEILEEVLETDDTGNPIYRHSDPRFYIVYTTDGKESLFLNTDGYLVNSGRGLADTPAYFYSK